MAHFLNPFYLSKCAVAKVEPNDTEERSSALTLQLDNSDWSSSPEDSNSSMYDDILTPVSHHESSSSHEGDCTVEADRSAVAEVNDRANTPVTGVSDEPVVDVSDKTVADISDELVAHVSDVPVVNEDVLGVSEEPVASVFDEPVENISDEPVADTSAARDVDNETNERTPIIADDNDTAAERAAVSENGYESEPELHAVGTDADQSSISDIEPDCETISENGIDAIDENNVGNTAEDSAVVDKEFLTDENNSSQDELDVISHKHGITTGPQCIDPSSSSPSPLSDDIADPFGTSKHIEIITLEEKEPELDCGVQPLPNLPIEFALQPSPDPIIPSPPRPRIEPLHDSVAPAPVAVKKIRKPIESISTASEEVVKQGSIIIRKHGKILRKSSRTKKKRTTQRKDSFQDYLEKTFDLRSFVIRLDKYKVGNEPNESEKMNFLSNFNLKRKAVFPLYSEHAYALTSDPKSPRTKRTFKTPQSERSKFRKVDRTSKVMRKKKQKTDLTRFNFTRSINTVEIERLDDDAYCRDSSIHEEHSYHFRVN